MSKCGHDKSDKNVFKSSSQVKCKNKCGLIVQGVKNILIIYVQKI